jgi:hypothetical protein
MHCLNIRQSAIMQEVNDEHLGLPWVTTEENAGRRLRHVSRHIPSRLTGKATTVRARR